ncbi:MAG: hypothetical protein LBD36_03330 [Holosporales bacterium]|nr:hypothetical protein [Holosporales bacterium]
MSFMLFWGTVQSKKHTSDIGFGWLVITKPRLREGWRSSDCDITPIAVSDLINSKNL